MNHGQLAKYGCHQTKTPSILYGYEGVGIGHSDQGRKLSEAQVHYQKLYRGFTKLLTTAPGFQLSGTRLEFSLKGA